MYRRNSPYQPPLQHVADNGRPYPYSPVNPNYPATPPTPFQVYAKPKQPSMPDPYAKNHYASSQTTGTSNLLHYFKGDNGELDVGKMVSAANQAAKTAQQLAPVVKEVKSMMQHINPGTRN
ncbi:hypothetical protein EU245_12635 [Lentibacillus lipolyticus]|nr:hypothetical protein EU245_12635 [Lentibacillus lipolyticus]